MYQITSSFIGQIYLSNRLTYITSIVYSSFSYSPLIVFHLELLFTIHVILDYQK